MSVQSVLAKEGIFFCHCPSIFDKQVPPAIQPLQYPGVPSLDNQNIMNLLQSLSKDVSELKQSLNTKKTKARRYFGQLRTKK
jgi:hypothetical protein